MLSFIVNKTADAYFCNLIWYIGNHAIELETCSVEEAEYVKFTLPVANIVDILSDNNNSYNFIKVPMRVACSCTTN